MRVGMWLNNRSQVIIESQFPSDAKLLADLPPCFPFPPVSPDAQFKLGFDRKHFQCWLLIFDKIFVRCVLEKKLKK